MMVEETIPDGQVCGCGCGCDEPATHQDESVYLCDTCGDYTYDDEGTCRCARQTEQWTMCPDCGEEIAWGGIQTHGPGASNDRTGTCGCGDAWLDEDRGGWGHYSYRRPTEDKDE